MHHLHPTTPPGLCASRPGHAAPGVGDAAGVRARGRARAAARLRTLVLALGWLLAAGACRSEGAGRGSFDGERAFEHIETQLAFGPRPSGSAALAATGEWIAATAEDAGWTVIAGMVTHEGLAYENIVARLGPRTAAPLVLGAHYDTRPVAERDAVLPDEPVPGANDGASGVAVLLELARVLPQPDPEREVWLVFFDGEDGGNIEGRSWAIGSTAFAGSMDVTPEAVVIVDMVGDADLQLPMEANSTPSLAGEIWGLAAEMRMPAFRNEVRHRITDDHTPFLELGIPSVLIIDFDYPWWHTTHDTLDKVSPASLEQVGRVLEAWVRGRR